MQPIITNSWAPSHPAANACSCYYGSSPYGSVPTSSWGSEGDQPWSAEDSSLWGSSSPNTIWTDDFYYGPSKPCVGWLCLMGRGGFWGGVSSHVPLQVPRYIGSPFFPPFPSFLQPVFVPLGRRPDPREGPRLAATAVGEGCVCGSGSGVCAYRCVCSRFSSHARLLNLFILLAPCREPGGGDGGPGDVL